MIAAEAAESLDALKNDATADASPEENAEVPVIGVRSYLRAVRSALWNLSGDAVGSARKGVFEGVEKHFESMTVAGLAGAKAWLLALATGLPAEFGWLAGIVAYLARTAGPSRGDKDKRDGKASDDE